MKLKIFLSTIAIFACASSAEAAHIRRHHVIKHHAIKPTIVPKAAIARPHQKTGARAKKAKVNLALNNSNTANSVINPPSTPKTVVVQPYIRSENGKTAMVDSYMRASPGTKIAEPGSANKNDSATSR